MGANAKRHAATSWILLAASAACNLAAYWTGPSDLGFNYAIAAVVTGICAFIESIRTIRAKD